MKAQINLEEMILSDSKSVGKGKLHLVTEM